MLFLLALLLIPLTCGVCTAWCISRTHSLAVAATAGAAVTVVVPLLLLLAMVAAPALGFAVALGSALAALTAYDKGRIVSATTWAAIAALAMACATWGQQ
ncbi:hypothetical protein [Streptomyces sp. NPDC048242]|uniref:hypothetical protein n=1 Tax=Streptomyces sp. NPDC048242 TaxID=3155026 RepID=UPI0034275A8D